jgi:hypothetical protein
MENLGHLVENKNTSRFTKQRIYKDFYKLLVCAICCSSLALTYVIQRAIVLWLRDQEETCAAEWRSIGRETVLEIGCTNKNDGTEGNWGGLQKAVC